MPEERLLFPEQPTINPKDLQGLWIPKQILNDNNLTSIEKFLLSYVWHLDGENNCYASNGYLADLMGLSTGRIANVLTDLRKKGYVEQVSWDGKIRKLRCLNKMT